MQRLLHDTGFLIHLSAYIAVNAILIVINLWQTPNEYWFYWPLLGWGAGILGHAAGIVLSGRSRS